MGPNKLKYVENNVFNQVHKKDVLAVSLRSVLVELLQKEGLGQKIPSFNITLRRNHYKISLNKVTP